MDNAPENLLRLEDAPASSNQKRSDQFLNSTTEYDKNEGQLFRRDGTAVIKDTRARSELRFISMTKSERSLAWKSKGYNYKAKAGAGVTIYVHNLSGINLAHAEFQKSVPGVTKGTVEYLYLQSHSKDGHYFRRGPKPKTDVNGHGTCVADKAVGRLNGVAKGANLKFVPYLGEGSTAWKSAGLQAIVNDIKERRDSTTGGISVPVINFSYGFTAKTESFAVKLYRKFLQALVDLDAVIIISAGNDGVDVFHYPALFAREDAFKNNILVVGNVRLDGSRAPSSNRGPLIAVSAPADGPFDTFMRSWCVEPHVLS